MEPSKKAGRYDRLLVQIEDLLKKSNDPIAHMATVAAILHNKIEYFFWCGFYRIVDGELIVGPYQGSVACQILAKNRGVCWAAINENRTMVVADVHQFPGHIACDSRSKSEIVVPIRDKSGQPIAVLDVDSKELNSFDEIDAKFLEEIVALLAI